MGTLLDCLAFGRDERKYNEDVRSFALTLHYYSPRGYNYVRSKFNNHLPSPSAIKKWYAGINSSAGFDSEAFEVLRVKVNEYRAQNKTLVCALIKDEMAIKKHSQWNPNKKKFDGFVDMGQRVTNQGIIPLATEALVFLVAGVSEVFKIPIAYFLIDSLDAAQSAFVTNEIIMRLSEIGVEIASLTLDGMKTNFAMCRALGANFNGNAYIFDPLDEHRKIYIFIDTAHCYKNARNCFASRNLVDGQDRLIQWHHIELLYEAQKDLAWNLGNKLTKAHLQWQKRKMNVQLVGETLSRSVADSLEFAKQMSAAFADVDGTIDYVRNINDVFDTMNSTKSEGAVGFKRPFTTETFQEFSDLYDNVIEYIKGLRVEGESKPILSSLSNVPFTGFYNNMINFRALFNDYVLFSRSS